MSRTSLKEKFEDEQLLSTVVAIELEDVKTLAQLNLEKSIPTHSGAFSVNVEYYIKKIFKELDNVDSRLKKLETGEQPSDWNLYKIVWKLENFSVVFNNAKQFEELKKNNADPNLERDFFSTAFLSKPYGYSFFTRAFPFGCGPALGKSMSITISLIAGPPFDDILTWPFEGSIQISVFRQDNSSLIWTNLLKTNDETTPCFSRPSPLQPKPKLWYLLSSPRRNVQDR